MLMVNIFSCTTGKSQHLGHNHCFRHALLELLFQEMDTSLNLLAEGLYEVTCHACSFASDPGHLVLLVMYVLSFFSL
jgi:hypothetical protein